MKLSQGNIYSITSRTLQSSKQLQGWKACSLGQQWSSKGIEIPLCLTLPISTLYNSIQAHLRDTEGLILDHRNTVSIAIKPVIIFSLVEGLAFHLWKTHLWRAIEQSAIKWGIPLPRNLFIYYLMFTDVNKLRPTNTFSCMNESD